MAKCEGCGLMLSDWPGLAFCDPCRSTRKDKRTEDLSRELREAQRIGRHSEQERMKLAARVRYLLSRIERLEAVVRAAQAARDCSQEDVWIGLNKLVEALDAYEQLEESDD